MKKHSYKGYSHATCMDCTWELQRINAQAVGAKHAKTHKHKGLVTTEIESVYDGRDSQFKKEKDEVPSCSEEAKQDA